MKAEYKHLELISKLGIKEKDLPKEIRQKMTGFTLQKAKADKNPENEGFALTAERISDELNEEISNWHSNYAAEMKKKAEEQAAAEAKRKADEEAAANAAAQAAAEAKRKADEEAAANAAAQAAAEAKRKADEEAAANAAAEAKRKADEEAAANAAAEAKRKADEEARLPFNVLFPKG